MSMTLSGMDLRARICQHFPFKRTMQTAKTSLLHYCNALALKSTVSHFIISVPGITWRATGHDNERKLNMNKTINTTPKLLLQTSEYCRRLTASIGDSTALRGQQTRIHDTSAWHTVPHHVAAVCHDITLT